MQSMEFHHVRVRPTEQIDSHEHPARERFIYGIMGAMENNYGCVLIHAKTGGQLPAEFTSSYHVHHLGQLWYMDAQRHHETGKAKRSLDKGRIKPNDELTRSLLSEQQLNIETKV